ncbi:MAG: V-type ATP synthase subunit E [Treponema sp.]|jgi:V/A-type H+-transporting ATPase subunit E|nr:V-type ATP synthase subunit E [Treponema sp.]
MTAKEETMDIQLQELVDKIKKDGIEAASREAARLAGEAEAQAKHVVELARKEAQAIVEEAKTGAERFERAGIAALEQASRNLVLAFKGEIQALLDRIVSRETAASYGEDVLKAVLPDLVKSWAANSGSGAFDVILPEGEFGKLQSYFTGKLAAELGGGVELKSDRNLAAGFRIADKDGSAYYDFSAEAVSELLSAYLNPRLAGILKDAARG